MTVVEPDGARTPRKRADARRNEATILGAAGTVFAESGVDAPIRDVAARAGVGTATIYRHFPTRADLIVALYRHQVDGLVAAAPAFSRSAPSAHAALARWIDLFVDFVVTKQGLATVLQSDEPCFDPLHSYFEEQLQPVCAHLLDAAVAAGEIEPGHRGDEIMLAVGGLCAAASHSSTYDVRRVVGLLVAGLRT